MNLVPTHWQLLLVLFCGQFPFLRSLCQLANVHHQLLMLPWNHSRDHLIAEDDRRRQEGGWGEERRAGKVTGDAHNLISTPHLNLRISRSRMTLAFSRKWLFGSSLHLITPPINFSRCGDSSDGGRTPIIILMKPNAAFTTSRVCEDSKVHMVETSWLAMPELSTSEGEGEGRR